MSQEKQPGSKDVGSPPDEDVEGNSLLIGSTISGDMARIRSREVERAARQHAQAKEAKAAKPR